MKKMFLHWHKTLFILAAVMLVLCSSGVALALQTWVTLSLQRGTGTIWSGAVYLEADQQCSYIYVSTLGIEELGAGVWLTHWYNTNELNNVYQIGQWGMSYTYAATPPPGSLLKNYCPCAWPGDSNNFYTTIPHPNAP